jgi:hypothetical protein
MERVPRRSHLVDNGQDALDIVNESFLGARVGR